MAEEIQEETFSLIYNDTEIPISRYKFAVYSQKFRKCPEFASSNSLKIVNGIPLSTFSQFIAGAQGEEFEISKDNCLDLLDLANEWETTTLSESIMNFISENADYSEICERLKNNEAEPCNLPLESILTKNLNEAIKLPSFKLFKIDVLIRIILRPNIDVDQHILHRFVMDMFELHKEAASPLASAIDIRKLTSDEAEELLNSPYLQREHMNTSLGSATLDLLRENREMKERMGRAEATLQLIMSHLQNVIAQQARDQQTIADLSSKLQVLSGAQETNQKDHMDALASQKSELLERIAEAEKKAHSDLRKTNKSVNCLTRKSSEYDDQFKVIQTDISNHRKAIINLQQITTESEKELWSLEEHVLSNRYTTTSLDFAGRPLAGIMAHVKNESRQISVTASTSDYNEPHQVADMGWDDIWFTENKPDQWIMYDFKDMKVQVTHYTLKSHKYPAGTPHIKSWVVEGSRNGRSWVELDKRAISVLNGPSKFQTFPCKVKEGTFRFIRLRQIGPNARGDGVLALTNFELFGKLMVANKE